MVGEGVTSYTINNSSMNIAEQFGNQIPRAEQPANQAEEREPVEEENEFENEPRQDGESEDAPVLVEGKEGEDAVLRILKEIAELSPRGQRQIREVLTDRGAERTQAVVEEERANALRAVRERLTQSAA